MDTQNKENYKSIIIVFVLLFAVNIFASSQDAIVVLKSSYETSNLDSIDEIENTITLLDEQLRQCSDNRIRERVQYRKAVLAFKAGKTEQAKDTFELVANQQGGDELVRLCSLNMAAQILRMQADDSGAMEYFGKVIKQSKQLLQNDADSKGVKIVGKLLTSAMFARAEICCFQEQYSEGVSEYNQLLDFLIEYKGTDNTENIPLVLDMMAQLYLKLAEYEKFYQATDRIALEYPDYHRAALVKFEADAVKLLKAKDPQVSFENGSLDAPAKMIAFLKKDYDKPLCDEILNKTKQLIDKSDNAYIKNMLNYHYAWLLDIVGEKQKAAEVFGTIYRADTQGFDSDKNWNLITKYAVLQRAIILGELGNYKKAIAEIYSTEIAEDDPHVFALQTDIIKSLETLKREVSNNEKKD